MKSYDVRHAAGAGTILVFAYAIALAQKDKQAVSDSWNAESAVAMDPAVPIGNGESQPWLDQPNTQLADQQQALSFNGSTDPAGSPSPIEQVNHDQPIDATPAVAMAGFNSFSPDPSNEDQTTLVTTPQVPLPNDAILSPEAAIAADGTFPNTESGFQTQSAASLSLPDSGATGFANPSFDTPPSGVQELVASAPEPFASAPEPFASAPEPFASAPELATGFGTPMLETTAAEEQAAMTAPGIGGLPDPNVSTFADVAAAGLATTAVATAALTEATPAGAGLGFPTDTPVVSALPESTEIGVQATSQELPTAPQYINGVPTPANTLRGSAPVPNNLRSTDVTGAFAGSNAGDLVAEPPPTFDNQPRFQNSVENSSGLQAFAADPAAAGMEAGSLAALGASVMINPATAAPVAGPATFRTEPTTTSNDGYAANPVNMVPPNTAIALAPNATTDEPGERRLEGAQTPSVIIQKRAPAEVKVGKPAAFIINVRNVGAVEALDVEVHDRIPAGMRLADASPPPQIQGNLLMWQIGSMPAGDERTITLQLIPEQEGELGSVARVSFEAAASVRTIATRPMLKIEQQAPEKVLIGQQLEIGITISNTGSGKATNVEIWEDVPIGLSHPEGPQLKQNIGTLMPGEVRNDSLFLKTEKPGIIQNTSRLVGDDGLTTEETVAVEVIAPQLQVTLKGPSRRFLERQASYELNVSNAGTAAATNVEISVQLSRGFTFVSTDFEGQYDPNRHAVFWSLAQLPPGSNGVVPLTLLPVETGEQVIKINASADLSSVAQTERKMTVEGFADLDFSITNPKGPIEIGADTTYDIVVHNSGSKPDTNIRVQVQLPAGLELLSVDGDAGTDGNGLVAFQPKTQLAPGQEFKYRVRVRGTTAGTHIAKAVVVSDQSSVPVTKEDTTRVYADH